MNAAAGQLVARVLLLQLLVGGIAVLAFVVGAPFLLLLDADEARGAFLTTLWVALATESIALLVVGRRLARLRYVLRALALGSRAFEADELTDLARVPQLVTFVTAGLAVAFSALTVSPPFRATGIDFGTAASLFLLSFLVILAAALPLYVILRTSVSRAMELVPPDAARDVLVVLERDDIPRRRVVMHMIAAVVIPISVVAAGSALVAHAHVRAEAMQARVDTAIAIARGALPAYPGSFPTAGRADALMAAREAGFYARVRPVPERFTLEREPDGRVTVIVPLEEESASVSFAGSRGVIVAPAVLVASAVALLLSAWLGLRLGKTLARDLVIAAHEVRDLGNEDVLRGRTRVARPARFEVVTALGRAIETLAERFRMFAAAQERAIEAREATLRLRGLLFASVSHDLKSPLNSILGFCTLAGSEPLADSQLESLGIIERRGRELLALIETILDAARVEAQKLTLQRAQVRVADVIAQAVRRGDELGPMDAAPVEVHVDPALPLVRWDEARVAQALAALIGHAKRLSPKGGVRIDALRRHQGGIVIRVEDPSTVFSPLELGRLLDANNAATAPRRFGGLALGLSLSRALIALHGGRLGVERGDNGVAVFRAVLPVDEGPLP